MRVKCWVGVYYKKSDIAGMYIILQKFVKLAERVMLELCMSTMVRNSVAS